MSIGALVSALSGQCSIVRVRSMLSTETLVAWLPTTSPRSTRAGAPRSSLNAWATARPERSKNSGVLLDPRPGCLHRADRLVVVDIVEVASVGVDDGASSRLKMIIATV